LKKGKIISYKRTNSAAIDVQRELQAIGLWHAESELFNTEVYWCPIPRVNNYGVFFHGTDRLQGMLGYKTGHIYIPGIVLANIFWQHMHSVRDVIRHEYAHAFAHYYPKLIIRSKEFESVYGGKYYSSVPSQMEDEAYVSDYAKTIPMEDFAETFMVFVRRRGVMPKSMKNVKLKKKWKFIAKTILLA
jgi:hypothetical protein